MPPTIRKHDADTEAALLSDAFVTFIHHHDFNPGVSSRKGEKAGRSLLRKRILSYWNCAIMSRYLMAKRVAGPLGSKYR